MSSFFQNTQNHGFWNSDFFSKKCTGHIFNIKLEEKSYKMSFKVLPVKIQWSKHQQCQPSPPPPTGVDRVLFFTINLLCLTSSQISAHRKLNLLLTSSIYLVFLPLKVRRRLKQTKTYHIFLLYLKRNDPQTFTSCSCEKLFLQCVYVCW